MYFSTVSEFNGFFIGNKKIVLYILVIHESIVHWNVLQLLTLNYAAEWERPEFTWIERFYSVNRFQLPSFSWKLEWMVDGSEVPLAKQMQCSFDCIQWIVGGSEAHSISKIGVESLDNKRILSFEIVHYCKSNAFVHFDA